MRGELHWSTAGGRLADRVGLSNELYRWRGGRPQCESILEEDKRMRQLGVDRQGGGMAARVGMIYIGRYKAIFFNIWPLGRFSLYVDMSIGLSVCLCYRLNYFGDVQVIQSFSRVGQTNK